MRNLLILLCLFSVVGVYGSPIKDSVPNGQPQNSWTRWSLEKAQMKADSGYMTTFVDTVMRPKYPMIILSSIDSGMWFWDMVKWQPVGLAYKDTILQDYSKLNNMLGARNNVAASIKGFYSDKDGGEGTFFWDDTAARPTITGLIQHPLGVDTGAWVRVISEPLNLRWLGAKGVGVTEYKVDSTALVNAVTFIENNGGGKLFIPEGQFCYRGIGLRLRANTEVYGLGAASEIRNVDPQFGNGTDSGGYRGTIFYTGTLSPTNPDGMFKAGMPTYNAYDAKLGDIFIRLRTIGDTTAFHNWGLNKDKPIIIGSNAFDKHGDANKKRFSRGEQNSVVYIGHDSLFLEFPLANDYYADTAQVHIKIVNGSTNSSDAWLNQPDFTAYNISIHDLKLTQTIRNEITGQALVQTGRKALINSPIGGGEVFKGQIYNCIFDGYGGLAVNMMNQFKLHSNTFYSTVKYLDLGFLTCNTDIYDNTFFLRNSPFFDTTDVTNGQSLIYLNEGSSSVNLYNNYFGGTYNNVIHILQIAGAFHRGNIYNNTFNLPNYSQPNMYAFSISDGNHGEGDSCYSYGITVKNNIWKVGEVGRWIRCVASPEAPKQLRDVVFDNNIFQGQISQTSLTDGDSSYACVYVHNFGDIKMYRTTIPAGDTIVFNPNYAGALIDHLYAPTNYLAVDLANNCTNLNVKASNLFTMVNNNTQKQSGAQANTAFGIQAMSYLNNGGSNTVMGSSAFRQADSSFDNTIIGRLAMKGSPSMDTTHVVLVGNTAVGSGAAINILSHADSNTVVGFRSGYDLLNGVGNTLIGANTTTRGQDTSMYAVALGYNAKAYNNTFSLPDNLVKYLRWRGIIYEMPDANPTVGQVLTVTSTAGGVFKLEWQ